MAWDAPEYEYNEKSPSWYWITIIAAALIVAFAIYERNFLFGLFIVVGEVLLIVWGNRPPRMIRFSIAADSISLATPDGPATSHLFKEFESMSVNLQGDEWAEIAFSYRAKLRTPLKLLFPQAKLADLRANMKTVLREVPYEPTFIDSIEKLLRF